MNKQGRELHLPDRIMGLEDPSLIGACISQFLDDEGNFSDNRLTICLSTGNYLSDKKPRIKKEYAKYSSTLLKELQLLLAKINVKSSFRAPCPYFDTTLKKWKLSSYLRIKGFENLLNLWPHLSLKRHALKEALRNRIQRTADIAFAIEKIQNQKGHFTTDDIVCALNISKASAKNYIQTLKRARAVERLEKGYYRSIHGKSAYIQTKYTLTIPNILRDYFSA